MLSTARWSEARQCVGRMAEVSRTVGPPIHGRLEHIPDIINGRRAEISIFVEDDPEGVRNVRKVRCVDVVGIVIQPRQAA